MKFFFVAFYLSSPKYYYKKERKSMFWLDLSHYCNYCTRECLSTPKSNIKAYDDYIHQMQLLVVNINNHLNVIDSIGINRKLVRHIKVDTEQSLDFSVDFDKTDSTLTIYIPKNKSSWSNEKKNTPLE